MQCILMAIYFITILLTISLTGASEMTAVFGRWAWIPVIGIISVVFGLAFAVRKQGHLLLSLTMLAFGFVVLHRDGYRPKKPTR